MTVNGAKRWMVRSTLLVLLALVAGCDAAGAKDDGEASGPKPVAKTNAMRIYMHYMPWFESKEVSGYWGSHWRMNTRNPDQVDADGKRAIASHYYPLIGPYDSADPAVIEYHLLLMKYAGVDAVLIDWYGSHSVYDYRANLLNSNALIARLADVGLDFGIVYEEFTASNVGDRTEATALAAARADVKYMADHYFGDPAYVQVDGKPLVLTFGPRHFTRSSQWDAILGSTDLTFLPLWGHTSRVGAAADGEYAWVDFEASLAGLEGFYNGRAAGALRMGAAFPRFHDFYQEGGWGQSYGYVDAQNGQMLRRTLELARQHGLAHLQLVTWNDFGEGTALEPTRENGYAFLETIQGFTGVPYGRAELELVHRYYLLKKRFGGQAAPAALLETAFAQLAALQVEAAAATLDKLPA